MGGKAQKLAINILLSCCREGLWAWKSCLAGLDSLIQSEVIRIPRGERLYLTARTYFLWTSSGSNSLCWDHSCFLATRDTLSLAPGKFHSLYIRNNLALLLSYTRSLIMKINQSMLQSCHQFRRICILALTFNYNQPRGIKH